MRKRRGRDGPRDGILQVFTATIINRPLQGCGAQKTAVLNPARRTAPVERALLGCTLNSKIISAGDLRGWGASMRNRL